MVSCRSEVWIGLARRCWTWLEVVDVGGEFLYVSAPRDDVEGLLGCSTLRCNLVDAFRRLVGGRWPFLLGRLPICLGD